ncbi:hypothetical protein GMRT_10851 [Giardia muris]|uniref:Uncharacterized protein n=1 Tax=Giardia muris TaxID=5742 RepID=A0A4Z1T3B3_GIAMU|nr:hypothetical protein GMRT_10851 [Giardia muris]|eukprot:TNJ27547.1 hypothetical protein GMRT_10851 [Giardia muris]
MASSSSSSPSSSFTESDAHIHPRPDRRGDLTRLAKAVMKTTNRQLDTREHGPVLLSREGREASVAKEQYAEKLSAAIRLEKQLMLNQGHVIPNSRDPTEEDLKLIKLAFRGVTAFTEAVAEYHSREAERQAQKTKALEREYALAEARRGHERLRWKSLEKTAEDQEDDPLDEFLAA